MILLHARTAVGNLSTGMASCCCCCCGCENLYAFQQSQRNRNSGNTQGQSMDKERPVNSMSFFLSNSSNTVGNRVSADSRALFAFSNKSTLFLSSPVVVDDDDAVVCICCCILNKASAYENDQLGRSAKLPSNSSRGSSSSSSSSSSFDFEPTITPKDLTNPVILYDGVCNFCNTWVDLLLRIDAKERFRFAPLQSTVGKSLLVSIGKQADDISSVVLVTKDGNSYDKSRCVLKVVQELGPLASIASNTALAVVPEPLRDGIYDTVAENRYNLMGKRDECRCSDPRFADRFLLD
mmetsp:Transcript_17637/g.27008  ORF Transcript_17637/g.27008 Transcript_17637/m.27008 type:complete len:294 (-) Transcript_17637:6-887(-)